MDITVLFKMFVLYIYLFSSNLLSAGSTSLNLTSVFFFFKLSVIASVCFVFHPTLWSESTSWKKDGAIIVGLSESSLSCIGEGNGNPLQCSCLENPMDGGAWWAAVYGVAQSWT